MNVRKGVGLAAIAVLTAGCAVSADETAGLDELAFEEGETLTKEAGIGEITCPDATPNSTTSDGTPNRSFTAAEQDNPQCRWGYVYRVNNVTAGTYFYLRYNDGVPMNDLNCLSTSVRLETYKLTSGAWVLDAVRTANGRWGGTPAACVVPIAIRQIPSNGTYKLIMNGRYSALSYQFRSDIRIQSF